MIRVEKELAHFSEESDALGMMEATVNQMVNYAALSIAEGLKRTRCDKHPDQETVIMISGKHPDSGQMVAINIKSTCCTDFKKTLEEIVQL
jgi:hypothetical protein